MRTIEEICAVIDEIAMLSKRYELMQYTEEIRNVHKAEKEQIIKVLVGELYILLETEPKDTYEFGFNEGIRKAIEIVKAGGKE